MAAALFCFSLLAVASRELLQAMSAVEIMLWRSLIGFAIILALLWRADGLAAVPQTSEFLGWHLLRNSAHFGGQCAWLVALAALPMAEVFALEFTTPLWAALLAAMFMGESLGRGRWLSLLLGLGGVLLILRPGMAAVHPASLVMLAGAVGFGISVITTRKLTQLMHGNRHSFLLILLFMTGMQGLMSALLVWPEFGLPARGSGGWLLAASLTALAAHYCLSRALGCADAALVMPIDYLRLPLIMLVGWWLYDESITAWLAAGALLIIGANAFGLYLESVRMRRQRGG